MSATAVSQQGSLGERFRCVPLGCVMSRSSCGARHVSATATAEGRAMRGTHLWSASCVKCPVGERHAQGELASAWADGKPLELVSAFVDARRLAAASAAPRPIHTPPPAKARAAITTESPMVSTHGNAISTMLTLDGVTDSIRGWSKRLGMTDTAIRMRMKRTTDVREILAPRKQAKPGEAKPRTRPSRSKAARKERVARAAPAASSPLPARAKVPAPAEPEPRVSIGTAVEILRRLGFDVEDMGAGRNGARLLIVAGG